MSGRAKIVFLLIIFSLLSFSSCKKGKFENELSELDTAVLNAPYIANMRIATLDSISEQINNIPEDSLRIEKELCIANHYLAFDLNKALTHIKKAQDIAETNLPDLNEKCSIALASIYTLQGSMEKEAYEITETINKRNLSDSLLLDYFILSVKMYNNLTESSFDPELKKDYQKMTDSYRDSVLKYDSANAIIGANRLRSKGELTKALELIKASKPALPDTDRSMAPYYHYLSSLYSDLNEPDSQIYYLIKASLIDMKNGVREYSALPELAYILKDKDIARAKDYISRSRQDAVESNSHLRRKEIGPKFTEIQATYSHLKNLNYRLIRLAIIFLVIIILFIISAYITLKNKNKTLNQKNILLNKSQEEITKMVDEIKIANKKLEENNKMKEIYLTSAMEQSLSFIKNLETFRMSLGKKVAQNDWDGLSKIINSSQFVNEEIRVFFEEFDKAFLSLYPDFIDKLNSLLRPEEKYFHVARLTTELRIYALLWLGVSDGSKISAFLRCSDSTVYNYRTKMRNKAINRESFEEDLQSLK